MKIEHGVGVVTVDNPPVNTLDDDTLLGLTDAANTLGGRDDVRAVVLTGTGKKAFLAGADLRELAPALGENGVDGALEHHVALTAPAFHAWASLPQPAIAAVGANALGGGLEFAMCCDLVLADPRARFGLPEVTLGLMPGGGGTQRLHRWVGPATALRLVLLGEILDARQAQELGLVSLVAAEGQALDAALDLAKRLAKLPAIAVQSAKRAVRVAVESESASGLSAERELFLAVARSADAREGVEAFLAKRRPVFSHR